jgi:hypothetical protein
MKTVAIMQPTFLPWVGYFAMFDRVDEFVFLDSVQFARRSWQQRNKIKTAQGGKWVTVPVHSKGLRDQRINEILIDTKNDPYARIKNSLRVNYGGAPYFEKHTPAVFEVLSGRPEKLVDLNLSLIGVLAKAFGVVTPTLRTSELEVEGSKTEHLVSICRACEAERYLAAPGSKTYLDDTTAFQDAGIEVAYHEYEHPVYDQRFDGFESHMAAVDLLFNTGDGALELISSGLASVAEK